MEKPYKSKQYCTVEQAKNYLGLSVSRVTQIVQERGLTKYRINAKCYLLLWSEIEALRPTSSARTTAKEAT